MEFLFSRIGYAKILLLAVIGSIVAIWVHERQQTREIEYETANINRVRRDINTAHRRITGLATLGEGVASWNEADCLHYRSRRLQADSLLNSLKQHCREYVRPEQIDTLRALLAAKETHLLHIMEMFERRTEADSLLTNHLPEVARRATHVRTIEQKKKGIAGFFGKKEKIQVMPSQKELHTFNDSLIAMQQRQASEMDIYTDSLRMRNRELNRTLNKLINDLDEQAQTTFLQRELKMTEAEKLSFFLMTGVIGMAIILLIISHLIIMRDINRRERDKAFRQALYTLECFAKDYGEDGCCSEGAEYYRHAALCMLDAMEILDSVSKGALSSCFMDGKIRNMLSYAAKVNVQGDFFINFADCSARPGHAGCREFRAGMLTGNRDLMDFAKNQMDGSDRRERLYLDEISFFHRILAASMEHRIESHKAGLYRTEDAFFPSIELLVQRKGPYVFAIKGGDNNDSHNHNDVGSMTLYKDGRPLLIDIGVEVYTAKTFSSRRYEIWTMRSVYHNTVNFAGVEEKAGEEYKATGMTRDGGITTMRLERAYGDDRITAYERKVDFSESGLSVEETIVSSLERTLTLMSIERPQVEGREIHLGTLGCVVLLSDVKDIETEEYVVDDDKLDKAWGKGSTLFRTLVKFDGNLEWRIY